MKKQIMMKKRYASPPQTTIVAMDHHELLAGTETLPVDPEGPEIDESEIQSKQSTWSDFWDDDPWSTDVAEE